MSPLTAFLTGLSTGGLTCLAVQGGLLLGLLAIRQDDEGEVYLGRWQRLILPVNAFLVAKILVYSIFGFALGALGSQLQLSGSARIWLQLIAALFMIATGVRLIFPRWLPWLNIGAPAGIRRLVRRSARSRLMIAPAILGALTILIPCGTTIAMEAAAVTTGSAIQAARIMFAFTIGTAPLFFVLGILARGTAVFQRRLAWVAAAFVIGVGLYTFNGVLVLLDSPYSWQREVVAARQAFGRDDGQTANATITADSAPVITVLAAGYAPNAVTVPSGQPVKLTFKGQGNTGCTSVVRIPKLQVLKTLTPNGIDVVTATFPKPGKYTFTCGMGMYSGVIEAV